MIIIRVAYKMDKQWAAYMIRSSVLTNGINVKYTLIIRKHRIILITQIYKIYS